MIQKLLNPNFLKKLIVSLVALILSIAIASWLLGIPIEMLGIYEVLHIGLFTVFMAVFEMIYGS